MNKNMEFTPDSLIGQKTLITGETGTGKTVTTFFFLLYVLEHKHFRSDEISVLDFGPPKVELNGVEFAGTLRDYIFSIQSEIGSKHKVMEIIGEFDKMQWLTPIVNPYLTPRYSATNADAVLSACCHNFKHSRLALEKFISNPTDALIINDLGIYLHLGGLSLLKKALKNAKTVLMNAYLGQTLLNDHMSNISSRENKLISSLRNPSPIKHYSLSSIPRSFEEIYPMLCNLLRN